MYAMKISEGGRVVVPAEIRKALDIKDGDTVLWELKDGEAHLTTRREHLMEAQKAFMSLFPDRSRSLVDELIADRRAEAVQEDDDA